MLVDMFRNNLDVMNDYHCKKDDSNMRRYTIQAKECSNSGSSDTNHMRAEGYRQRGLSNATIESVISVTICFN